MKQRMPLSEKAIVVVGITAFVSAALLSMCSTGCITKRPEGSTNATWINVAAKIATNATYDSVSIDLITHSEHRSAYITAENSLTKLLKKDTISAMELSDFVASLPIKKFQSSEGMLWAITLATVFDASTGIQLDISSAPAVRKVAEAIKDGLHAALYPKITETRTITKTKIGLVRGRITI
jgi:hypothetical protein